MNFANPERPEVMGQFVASVRGMGEACRALDYPVVSGNVSLYNETNGTGIPPTPAIGGVGLVPDSAKLADIRLKSDGNMLILIGREEGHLGQSIYQNFATGKFEGAPPPVDLESEIKAGRLIRTLIREGRVAAVHDCADGGLLVAIAEMALAGGKHGLSRENSGLGVELYPYEGKLPSARHLVRRRSGPLRRRGHAAKGGRSSGARPPARTAGTYHRAHRRRRDRFEG